MREETEQEKQPKDDDECASLGFRDSDGEKSVELPDSPRPLSEETRNLTASELLLNKLVMGLRTRLEHLFVL